MTATPRSTLLQRFRRDVSGNALAIMGAAVLPLVAAVGAAIDISRDYMAKSRLQQACDAGVLAGRKAQGGNLFGSDAESDAREYFAINYPDGLYNAQDVAFTPTASITNEVSGTASLFLPSTIGRVVGYQGTDLSVDCVARLDVNNTDVMFVLDVSGSMDLGSGTPGVSRIQALRQAVIDFTDTLESARSPEVRLRYGFVAYSSAVNVGGALMSLDPSYIADSAPYQSRRWVPTATPSATNNSNCRSKGGTWDSPSKVCTVPEHYEHRQLTFDVSGFKAGNTIQNPANRLGGDLTWNHCIEERATVPATAFDPIPSGALDLDIDTAPSDQASRWKPMLDRVYYRNAGRTTENWDEATSDRLFITPICPVAQGQIVEPLSTSQVTDYVNTLAPNGGTYHDIGMIWGLRLLSATGLWAAHNTDSPNGLPIARHIIFMTDGEMAPSDAIYSPYGMERHDERVLGGTHNDTTLRARHTARFLAMCEEGKRMNVRVWAIAFGTPLSSTDLAQCADTGRSFEARSADQLNETFRRIATRIADLRLEE